jgi:signal transduction histidine kinase
VVGALSVRLEVVRNLDEAMAPFHFLTVIYLLAWLLFLLLIIIFSRYLNVGLVRPVLRLAQLADHVREKKALPKDVDTWKADESGGDEVTRLRRSFIEMVDTLERARREAEETDRVKTEFLSMVSHELRTPLTSVLGFTKMIRKRLITSVFPNVNQNDKARRGIEQVYSNLDVIITEGDRLTDLINDLLDLAKLESGKMEWKMTRLHLPELVEHVAASMASLFEEKGLACRLELDRDLPPVTGDRDRLIQVLINLVSNAIKFTDRGSVTCAAAREDGFVRVSVVDTGVGITRADRRNVFSKFRQSGDVLTDKPKGTGLGLPICKQIVEHHGGTIWMESEPGQGSAFHFTIPVNEDGAASSPTSETGARPAG